MLSTVEYIRRYVVSRAAQIDFESGRVYRTRELRRWSANPTRLAKRLVGEGTLRQAAHGLCYAPVSTRFGFAPPSDSEILRSFFEGSPFIISGPTKWNALGLGATAMFVSTLVYNTKRTGEFTFDGRRYLLRRVFFPVVPAPEYFVVDLIQNHEMAGISLDDLERGLVATLSEGRWDQDLLLKMAESYGTKATQALVKRAINAADTAL